MNFYFKQGSTPLLVSMPHVGTDIPDEIAKRLTAAGRERVDTDWHLVQLYDFAEAIGASTLSARWSRYVIDLNRPPENANLYPGQDTTGLCPVDTFHKTPLYLPGEEPDEAEIQQRLAAYWQPYHAQLRDEVARLVQAHGVAVVWDAHSIASGATALFRGQAARPELRHRRRQVMRPGHERRHPGSGRGPGCLQPRAERPASRAATSRASTASRSNGVHAIQLEMAQCIYMDEAAPYGYRRDLAQAVQPLLRNMLEATIAWAQAQAR